MLGHEIVQLGVVNIREWHFRDCGLPRIVVCHSLAIALSPTRWFRWSAGFPSRYDGIHVKAAGCRVPYLALVHRRFLTRCRIHCPSLLSGWREVAKGTGPYLARSTRRRWLAGEHMSLTVVHHVPRRQAACIIHMWYSTRLMAVCPFVAGLPSTYIYTLPCSNNFMPVIVLCRHRLPYLVILHWTPGTYTLCFNKWCSTCICSV